MKSSIAEIIPLIGTAMDGGFYAGRILVDGKPFAIIVAPKDEGEKAAAEWIADYTDVPGAKSYNDGLANTQAMAAAGSDLAKWAMDLRIAGHADWYLPSQDELEIIYRNLKPTTETNSQWGRSGINVSAIQPTLPYALDTPTQTQAEAFQKGSEQAFEETWYWSSTQRASSSDDAWFQTFDHGGQYTINKSYEGRARAVRRLPL